MSKKKSGPVSTPIAKETKTTVSPSNSKSFLSEIKFWGPAMVISFLVFLNTLGNEFVNWDDEKNFLENPYVVNITGSNFFEMSSAMFKQFIIGNYNPLATFTLGLDKLIYGFDNPSGWHLTNLLLHIACVFFAYKLSRSLQLSTTASFIVALLFGIHPMRVESVAWITERKDVLFGLFYLWALWLYVKQKSYPTTGRTVAIFLLFILSLFSKIQAVTLPLSMIAIDYFMDEKFRFKSIIAKLPFFVFSLIFGLVGIYGLQNEGSLDNGTADFPFYVRPFIGSFSFIIYLIKSIIPFRLSPLYPYPSEIPSWFYPTILIFPLYAWFVWKMHKQGQKVWVFGLLFFFFNVVLLLQILGAGQGYLADRFTYIPYFGLFFIMAYYADKYIKVPDKKVLTLGLVFCAFGAYAFMTVQQSKVWKNSETLWTQVLKYYQSTTLPYGNRANYRRSMGMIKEAMEDYEKAIGLQPSAETYNSRARLFFDYGNSRDTLMRALSDYNKAIEMDPDNPEFFANRGATHARLGDYPKSLEDLSKALELNPANENAYLNRSVLYYNTGQFDLALADMEAYLKYNPYSADIWFETGRIYAGKGNWETAMANLNKAITMDANQGLYYFQRALVKINTNDISGAKEDAIKAQSLGYNQISDEIKQKLGIN